LDLPKILVLESVTSLQSDRHKANFLEWRNQLESLGNGSLTERFDPLIFREIADGVILKDETLTFRFGCGLELTAD
jgi:hypothetical protein